MIICCVRANGRKVIGCALQNKQVAGEVCVTSGGTDHEGDESILSKLQIASTNEIEIKVLLKSLINDRPINIYDTNKYNDYRRLL